MPKPDKPNAETSVPSRTESGPRPAPDAEKEAPPRTPADIPGLGPIRVRALHKAGLDSLSVLRAAPMEQLMAVPGLSEIKARQILTFLARFPADAFPTSPPSPEPRREEAIAPATPLLTQWSSPDTPSQTLSPLQAEAIRTQSRIIALLLTGHAPDFRHRLLRGIERFAQRTEILIIATPVLTAKDRERIMRRLRRITENFEEVGAQEDFDRKAQLRLAQDLNETSDWLAAFMDQAENSRTKATKETHD